MSTSAHSVVFPETPLIKKNQPNRKMSFKYLMVIVYIYGGIHALVWILSKSVLTPLFQQLVYDRREYHQMYLEALQNLTLKLSSLVSYIPPNILTWETSAGTKYSDAQTQTEAETGVAESKVSFYNTFQATTPSKLNRKKKNYTKLNKSLSTSDASIGTDDNFYGSNHESQSEEEKDDDIRAPAEKANSRNDEFVESLKYVSNRVSALETASTVGLVNIVKYQLEDFDSMIKGIAIRDSNTESLKRYNVSFKNQKLLMDEVRKEIRSFKGSFLNARSFPSASNR